MLASYCPLLLICSATSLTPAVAATPLVTWVSAAAVRLLAGLAVRGGAGPNVLANRATALVTADEEVSSCPLLSAAGSFRLSAGARPSGKRREGRTSDILSLHQPVGSKWAGAGTDPGPTDVPFVYRGALRWTYLWARCCAAALVLLVLLALVGGSPPAVAVVVGPELPAPAG